MGTLQLIRDIANLGSNGVLIAVLLGLYRLAPQALAAHNNHTKAITRLAAKIDEQNRLLYKGRTTLSSIDKEE